MENTTAYIENLFKDGLLHNVAIRVGVRDNILFETYHSDKDSVNEHTLFDMASVTKILCTTSLSLIALDKGLLSLSDPMDRFFDVGENDITVKNLLTHTMGIGHKPLNLPNVNYDNVAEYILSIPPDIPVGQGVLYSCPGFIVLGKILEKVFSDRLDILFKKYVTDKLGMESTSFLPLRRENIVLSSLDEADIGRVNDYNCRYLGGVAGNAGVFSNVHDLTLFADMLLGGGKGLFSEETLTLASQNHTEGMSESRGLGFVYSDEKYERTGNLFPVGAIGHGGWTGQSVFADRKSGLYAIILTDATLSTDRKFGSANTEKVHEIMKNLHNLLKLDLNSKI
jgi:CubicO group peptidase (beta-lactamase class C family)